MSFLKSYKRLDNLCKDMYSYDKGVTAYDGEKGQDRNVRRFVDTISKYLNVEKLTDTRHGN